MSDWKPQVVKICKVEKHFNADTLDIVFTSIGDYPIVTKLGEYHVGDLAVYIPIDTIVPDVNEFFFLCPKHEGSVIPKYELGCVPERYRRIKAKKIRGQYSQGMLIACPLYINGHLVSASEMMQSGMPEETILSLDVVKILGLTKWEEEEEEASDLYAKKAKEHTQTEKRPEGWSIPYYDIDGLRKCSDCLAPDEEIVLTEKIHGANGSFCHDGSRLWVKSRNLYKKGEIEVPVYEELVSDVIEETGEQIKQHVRVGTKMIPSTDQWWEVARRLGLEDKLSQYPGLVFFGEVAGQVKGFRYDAKIVDEKLQPCLYLFDVWDLKSMRYLDYDDRISLIQSLDLTPAPQLYRGPWLGKEKMYPYAEGKTTTSGKHIREGFVLNTIKERFEPRLNGRMQAKLVGESYNLLK